ncbi:MAG: hypothetical protein KUG82_07630 [Pseudomonadales bacterium]|nr:hypothetical protein [Pseudomonadales bacterium]
MNTHKSNHNTADAQPLELLISALLYLMTRYHSNPCPNIRKGIIDHLIMLQNHPNTRNSDTLIKSAQRLSIEWAELLESHSGDNKRRSQITLQ